MKRRLAFVLAGAAVIIAGYLRLTQDLVDREEAEGASATPSTEPAPGGSQPKRGGPATSESAGTSGKSSGSGSKKAPAGATKSELYEIATKMGISGRSKMSKPELIKAINSAS
ncbi:MAG: Rho termination factor N-terminal domain-containing protein [Solirubrobacterales bacterium]